MSDIFNILDRKIRQMHKALADIKESDLSSIKVEHRVVDHGFYCKVDFSQGETEVGLLNIVSLLIANIACMKDHLKVWCLNNSKLFQGDKLIDSDVNVAFIHDLWNIDKHAELYRSPRSKHRPIIKDLRRTLCLSAGTSANAYAMWTLDPITGKMKSETQGGGEVNLLISGVVVDEYGERLGDFAEILRKQQRHGSKR